MAWLLIQAVSLLFPTFEAPPWWMKVFVTAVFVPILIKTVAYLPLKFSVPFNNLHPPTRGSSFGKKYSMRSCHFPEGDRNHGQGSRYANTLILFPWVESRLDEIISEINEETDFYQEFATAQRWQSGVIERASAPQLLSRLIVSVLEGNWRKRARLGMI